MKPNLETVLLVEDGADEREFFTLSVETHFQGIKPLLFNEGTSAQKYFSETLPSLKLKPFLILLDINLPGPDGFELLKTLKSHPETQTLPVTLFSTTRSKDDYEKGMKLGANCFIQKPLDFSDYSRSVKKIIEFWYETRPPRL